MVEKWWKHCITNTTSSFFFFLSTLIMEMSWIVSNDGGGANVGSPPLRGGGLGGFATLAASDFLLPPANIITCYIYLHLLYLHLLYLHLTFTCYYPIFTCFSAFDLHLQTDNCL